MHSMSTYDCYCRTPKPLSRRKDDMQTERSRGRSTKCTTSRSLKPETGRSAKKIPLIPARVVKDEQLDTKRSTVTFPISPVLSPETSAALEDVEKLLRNAQIQMKEIGKVAGSNRLRKHVNIYPDEASLDDENDQLLYIRERVAYKFQEANGWIDTDRANSKGQRLSAKDYAAMQSQKVIDLSAPRFNTSENRYKQFSRQRGLGMQLFGSAACREQDEPETVEKLKNNDQARPAVAAVDNKKIETCTVQMCPPVNIKAELKTQNLDDIHISPDPSFVQETHNVATYVFCHDSGKSNASPKHKEKFVKILENTGDEKGSSKTKIGQSEDNKSIEDLSNSSQKMGSQQLEMVVEQSTDVSVGDTKRIVGTSESTNETKKPVLTIFENKNYLESTASKNLNDRHSDDRVSIMKKNESNYDNRNAEQNVKTGNVETNDAMGRVVHKNEQKQVRFDEQALMVSSECNVESATNSEQNLEIPSKPNDVEHLPISKDNSDRFASSVNAVRTSNDHVSPSSASMQWENRISDEKANEMREKRKSEKELRYRMIDERFSRIVKSYCTPKENPVKIEPSYITPSTSINSTEEDSTESDDFDHLYEPSVNELDKVLVAYNKIIDNVARSTRNIDEFLSRPEVEQYRVGNAYEIGIAEKPYASTLPTRQRDPKLQRLKPETHTKLRTRKSIVENRSTLPSTQLNFNDKRNKLTKYTLLNKPMLPEKDYDSRKPLKRYTLPKNTDGSAIQPNAEIADRVSHWKKFPRKETAKFNRDSEIEQRRSEKELQFLETPLLRTERDSSALITSSSCPLSSSSDTKTVNSAENNVKDFRSTVVNYGKTNKSKKTDRRYFDRGSVQNMALQNTIKRGCPEEGNTERLIARVLREEASFIEDKIKNIFNVDQIVGIIVKSLVENLKDEKLSGRPRDLELLISENVSLSNGTCGNNGIIQMRSDDDSGKQSFHIECVESEDNLNEAETITCNVEIAEKSGSSAPIGKNVKSETGHNFTCRSLSSASESLSIKKNSSVKKIDDAINSAGGSWEKALNTNDNGDNIFPNKTNEIGEDQSVTLLGSGDKQTLMLDDKNLNFQETKVSVVDQQNSNKEYQIFDALEERNVPQNSNENIILNSEGNIGETQDLDSMPLTEKTEEAEVLKKDSSVLNEKILSTSDVILIAKKEASVASHLTDKAEKAVVPSGNNFSRVSSSDSLHGCLSLRSCLKNVSKTSSNNTAISQDIKKIAQVPKMGNLIDDRVRNANSSCYDYIFDKEKILLEVYDEVHRKFWSSTFNTNYSNARNYSTRLSNDISTISTVESNKIDTFSDTSQSEGELYLPSSSSYSLGEVRMIAKSRSDGENTNDFDNNPTTFFTKEMVASWEESSKSLIQSIGEI